MLLLSGREIAAAAVIVLLMGAVFRGSGFGPSRGVEIMISAALGLVAAALAWLLEVRQGLLGLRTPPPHHVAIMLAAVAIAAFRAHVRVPAGGDRATIALSMVAAVGIGAVRSPIYPAFLAGLAIAVLSALRRTDPSRAPLSTIGARTAAISAVILGAAAAVTLGLGLALPPLHDRVQDYAIETFGLEGPLRRSGFSRSMALGSLREIIRSDAKVFRVYGAEVTHLRGAVYDRYAAGRWIVPLEGRPKRIALSSAPPPERHSEVVPIGGETAHLFVPLDARAIGTPAGRAAVDGVGLLEPVEDDPVDRVWFVPEPGDRPVVRPPSPVDLEVPGALRADLEPIARRWTAGAETPRERLEAIRRRFELEYTYSLDFERDEAVDPIVEFLRDRKTGHCEYFASAMALLARTSSIAARVAGGFLVTERSTAGDYWIVRESNAHAWVEAWIDDAWVTIDPTPAGGIAAHMRSDAAPLDAIADRVSELASRAVAWLRERTVGQLLAALAIGLAFVFRKELAVLARRRSSIPPATYGAPPPELSRFLDRLRRCGSILRPGESLERFALRLPEQEGRLLLRYAAARYGSKEPMAPVLAALDQASGNPR